MAVIPLAPTVTPYGGIASAALYVTPLTTTDTYTVAINPRIVLHFRKTGAGSCNVILVTPIKVLNQAVADRTVVVPATTGDVMIGGLEPTIYADPLTGFLTFSCSEVTGLSVGVWQT